MEEQKISIYRSELKYMINEVKAMSLASEFQRVLIPDVYSTQGAYKVKSLYFDTINNCDFYNKRNGEYEKKKIRLRTYDANCEVIKLEWKEKVGDLQHKTSIIISRDEAVALMRGDYSFLLSRKEKEAYRFYSMLQLGIYRPVVMIEYDRQAYIYSEFNTRITFDRNVRYSEINFNIFDPNINYNYVLYDNLILEVKYNKILVRFIKKILANKGLTNVSYSKYEWCRMLLNV